MDQSTTRARPWRTMSARMSPFGCSSVPKKELLRSALWSRT